MSQDRSEFGVGCLELPHSDHGKPGVFHLSASFSTAASIPALAWRPHWQAAQFRACTMKLLFKIKPLSTFEVE